MNSAISTKPHYKILDGLRGVAAIIVVAFHILEAHATSHFDMMMNHGYLAVDFFFLLSGFVIGYAYDDRWDKITRWEFFKRRLVRLHPMIIIGMIIGAICFYFQDSVLWPIISEVPFWKMILIMLIGFTLIPVLPSMDIRGWQEMHPLNGPAWTLFFEYLANIFYGIGARKLSTLALSILVIVAGGALVHLTVTSPYGDVIGGWSLEPTQFYIGLVRLTFPFFAGLLLSRTVKLKTMKSTFFWCSLILTTVLVMPRIGDADNVWTNGLYESFIIILVFPLIIFLGASGHIENKFSERICTFLGDISYPIYITHYPLIYIYTGWVANRKLQITDTYWVALLVFIACIILAYLSLKLYDEPVRKWLTKTVILKESHTSN